MRNICDSVGSDIENIRDIIARYNHEKIIIDEVTYYNFYTEGISIRIDRDLKIDCVILHGNDDNRFYEYLGDLPFGLRFSMSRDECLRKTPTPSFSRGEIDIPILGRKPPIDRYNLQNKIISVEYDSNFQKVRAVYIFC